MAPSLFPAVASHAPYRAKAFWRGRAAWQCCVIVSGSDVSRSRAEGQEEEYFTLTRLSQCESRRHADVTATSRHPAALAEIEGESKASRHNVLIYFFGVFFFSLPRGSSAACEQSGAKNKKKNILAFTSASLSFAESLLSPRCLRVARNTRPAQAALCLSLPPRIHSRYPATHLGLAGRGRGGRQAAGFKWPRGGGSGGRGPCPSPQSLAAHTSFELLHLLALPASGQRARSSASPRLWRREGLSGRSLWKSYVRRRASQPGQPARRSPHGPCHPPLPSLAPVRLVCR